MKHLETFAVSETSELVHKTIIDAMIFLSGLHMNLPNTFEAIARYILSRNANWEGDTKDFLCD